MADPPLRQHPLVAIASVVIAALAARCRRRLDAVLGVVVFLDLFVYSQIAVALLGEGLRDLSKHLISAQYALDLVVFLTIANLLTLVAGRAAASGAGIALHEGPLVPRRGA